jgi:hypothetical protein
VAVVTICRLIVLRDRAKLDPIYRRLRWKAATNPNQLYLELDDTMLPERVDVVSDGEEHSQDLQATCPAAISEERRQPRTRHPPIIYGPTRAILVGGSAVNAATSDCV